MKNNKPKTNQQRSVADSIPMKMEQFLKDVYIPFELGLLVARDKMEEIQEQFFSMFYSYCKYYKLDLTARDDVQKAWDDIYDLKIYPDPTGKEKGTFGLGRKRNASDGEKDIVSARSPSRIQDRLFQSLRRVKGKTLKFSTLKNPSLKDIDMHSVCQQINDAVEVSVEPKDVIKRNLRDSFALIGKLIRSLLKDNASLALEFSEMVKEFTVSLHERLEERQKDTLALQLDAKATQVSTRKTKRATDQKVA